jgi:hypothetical protein
MPSSTSRVQGVTAPDFLGTLQVDGVPPNLVAATVVLKLKERTSGVAFGPFACTVDAPAATSGIVRCPGTSLGTVLAGTYYVEYDVNYADGTKDVFPSDGSGMLTIRPVKTF